MSIQGLAELGRAKAEHIPRNKMTWAHLADLVIRALKKDMCAVEDDEALSEAIERAKQLHARLEARDADKGSRVTKDAREGILLLSSIASMLNELRRVRDSEMPPSYETAGRATSLRQRWNRVGDPTAFIRTLMEACVARVLTSAASDGVKAIYTRALTHWQTKPTSSQASSDDGERVTWNDSDDEL
jgi:hypothetical protein